ncbi:hypothetical protein NXY56_004116 [Leishmania guyanensis]|uniref:Uncharacterized protein n=1 Tax=Leishmania guyanensis TaxID=5670 RepID=A0A1E1IZN8_LEIGU|nr:hypothetical protein, unknown function [Leishmania guyanensis]
MASELHFKVDVKGCAAAAYKINEVRGHLMDAKRVLLKINDHLRQIDIICRMLGIHPVGPASLAAPVLTLPRPVLHTSMVVHDKPSAKTAPPMLLSGSSDDISSLAAEDSAGKLSITPWGFTNACTFTPVSNMQHHAHLMVSVLPIDVIVKNALNFVATWYREESKCTPQQDLIHSCLKVRYVSEIEEEADRSRLHRLLLTVSEQVDRFIVMDEYKKFVSFCVDQEPMWLQAARQLQGENEAQLKTTENIYARFLIEDVTLREKGLMLQEATDYVVSLCFLEQDQRLTAQVRAVEHCCNCQLVPQVTSVPFEPHLCLHHHQHHNESSATAPAGGLTAPQLQKSRGDSMDRCSGSSKGKGSKKVKPSLSSVEVDPYRERWLSIIGFLTKGERGKAALH